MQLLQKRIANMLLKHCQFISATSALHLRVSATLASAHICMPPVSAVLSTNICIVTLTTLTLLKTTKQKERSASVNPRSIDLVSACRQLHETCQGRELQDVTTTDAAHPRPFCCGISASVVSPPQLTRTDPTSIAIIAAHIAASLLTAVLSSCALKYQLHNCQGCKLRRAIHRTGRCVAVHAYHTTLSHIALRRAWRSSYELRKGLANVGASVRGRVIHGQRDERQNTYSLARTVYA
eukprot:15950-Heterococcus_DN1.PRE.2